MSVSTLIDGVAFRPTDGVPSSVPGGSGVTGSGSGGRRSETVAGGRLGENALGADGGEPAVEGGVADAAQGTKLCDGEGSGGGDG